MLGAVPSPIMDKEKRTSRFGFAGVVEHTRCRVKNLPLLSYSDRRSTFYSFDVLNNLNLRGHDIHLVLKRGFEILLVVVN